MKKETRIIGGFCIIFVIFAIFFFYKGQIAPSKEVIYKNTEVSAVEPTKKTAAANKKLKKECAVYISGAVKKPGLFRYTGTARVHDAVVFAGGFKKHAAKDAVNLAKKLTDGEQILIPTKKQMKKTAAGKNSQTANTVTSASEAGKVNINTATAEQLKELPGIGDAKASLILEYRSQNGSFSKKEDLMKISGIKEGVYTKIKDFITIS